MNFKYFLILTFFYLIIFDLSFASSQKLNGYKCKLAGNTPQEGTLFPNQKFWINPKKSEIIKHSETPIAYVKLDNRKIDQTDSQGGENTLFEIKIKVSSPSEATQAFSHFRSFEKYADSLFSEANKESPNVFNLIKADILKINSLYFTKNLTGSLPDNLLIPSNAYTNFKEASTLTIMFETSKILNLRNFKDLYSNFNPQNFSPPKEVMPIGINEQTLAFKSQEDMPHFKLAEDMGFNITQQRQRIKIIEDKLNQFINYSYEDLIGLLSKFAHENDNDINRSVHIDELLKLRNFAHEINEHNGQALQNFNFEQSNIQSILKLKLTKYLKNLIDRNSSFLLDLVNILTANEIRKEKLFHAFQQFMANNSKNIIYNTGSLGITFLPSNDPNRLFVMIFNESSVSEETLSLYQTDISLQSRIIRQQIKNEHFIFDLEQSPSDYSKEFSLSLGEIHINE